MIIKNIQAISAIGLDSHCIQGEQKNRIQKQQSSSGHVLDHSGLDLLLVKPFPIKQITITKFTSNMKKFNQ